MLIDFTVGNYRSIKELVTLSMVAHGKPNSASGKTRRRIRPDHEIAQSFPVEGRDIELLPAAGIFGANASGKSNVLRALSTLFFFMQEGATGGKVALPVLFPEFRLDQSYASAPVSLEVRAAIEGMIYSYRVEMDKSRITLERLQFIPHSPAKMRPGLLFERSWLPNEGKFLVKNGPAFGEGFREIQESLQDHEPFMSILCTRLRVDVVRGFTEWLNTSFLYVVGISRGPAFSDDLDQRIFSRLHTLDRLRGQTETLLRGLDTGISSLNARVDEGKLDISVGHAVGGNEVSWDLKEESAGTQKLVQLSPRLLMALETGGLVLIDELGSSLHPNLTRGLVRLFQSEKANPNRAQLVFNSHDNTLQRGNLLRRDQIWFTERRDDGSTNLYPLTDFRPRNDLALEKAYLDGRFGAVPIIPDNDELAAELETSK